MLEEWKTVVYNGEVWEEYEVSNYGNVRSVKVDKHSKKHNKTIKPTTLKNGYLQVLMRKNGKRKQFLVHRVVAYTWIENDEPLTKTQVNHKNEIKTDNRVENLEWLSPKDNTHYGTGMERKAKTQGKRVKCVETGVIYDSVADTSRKTGLSQGNICQCCNGKRKSCGGFTWEFVD